MAGPAAHHALEGSAEGAFRFVSELACKRTDGFAARQTASGEQHPPAREISDGSVADQLPKSRRETGSRQADFEGQRRHRPAPRRPYMLVGECKQPSHAVALVEVESECLDEDHVGELLYNQDASRCGMDQLLPHPIEGPAQSRAISLALQMDRRRQQVEQQLYLRPGELKMAPNHRDSAAVVQLGQRALGGADKILPPIVGWKVRIARDRERPAVRQQKAVTLLKNQRLASAIHREPACA